MKGWNAARRLVIREMRNVKRKRGAVVFGQCAGEIFAAADLEKL